MRLDQKRVAGMQYGIALKDAQGRFGGKDAKQPSLPAGGAGEPPRRSSRVEASAGQDAGIEGALASLGFREAGGAGS